MNRIDLDSLVKFLRTKRDSEFSYIIDKLFDHVVKNYIFIKKNNYHCTYLRDSKQKYYRVKIGSIYFVNMSECQIYDNIQEYSSIILVI